MRINVNQIDAFRREFHQVVEVIAAMDHLRVYGHTDP